KILVQRPGQVLLPPVHWRHSTAMVPKHELPKVLECYDAVGDGNVGFRDISSLGLLQPCHKIRCGRVTPDTIVDLFQGILERTGFDRTRRHGVSARNTAACGRLGFESFFRHWISCLAEMLGSRA